MKTAAGIVLPHVSAFLLPAVSGMIKQVDMESIKKFIDDVAEECEKQENKYIQDRYEFINCYSKYIDDFKKSLETFTGQFDKPVIIFIDELDRCNPKFVIKLIEQLKHIFEIKNLAFILPVNKHELSNTIKGAYGSEMNGYAYYKKFITHDFTLNSIEYLKPENVSKFLLETMNKKDWFDFSDDFIKIAVKITVFLDLSLRDIEQILDYLYYIKEKVTEEYHKEYLIICFFIGQCM